ncbi:MAG: succinate dehydrogenase, partial [Halobacteriota archaeon]
YLGPAALTKAHRFVFDEREGDRRRAERLEMMADDHAVWRCQTQFSCTEVCPKDIPITENIQDLKRETAKRDLSLW